MSIQDLKETVAAQPNGVESKFHAQVQSVEERKTRTNKPFLELTMVDSTGSVSWRVWSDNSSFAMCQRMKVRDCLEITGYFKQSEFGIESSFWKASYLEQEQIAALFAGDAKQLAATEAEMKAIDAFVASMKCPIYGKVCRAFVTNEPIRRQFMRAAAARENHHARRGGLVAHTAQMMRSADALAWVYPVVNRSLLLAGAFS